MMSLALNNWALVVSQENLPYDMYVNSEGPKQTMDVWLNQESNVITENLLAGGCAGLINLNLVCAFCIYPKYLDI